MITDMYQIEPNKQSWLTNPKAAPILVYIPNKSDGRLDQTSHISRVSRRKYLLPKTWSIIIEGALRQSLDSMRFSICHTMRATA